MKIVKYYHHRGDIDEISKRHVAFSKFKNSRIRECSDFRWKYTNTNEISYHVQVSFFGKSGYGKSSTVNEFFGSSVLKTSDIEACTRNCDSLDFEMSPGCYLSFADFPGIGESEYRDKEYLEMYKNYLSSSTVVVYVLRADTRDYAVDELAYQSVFASNSDKGKVIFALNCCDKIEPISRSKYLIDPNSEQMINIGKKVKDVNSIFCPVNEIIPYSAETGWNMNALAGQIVKVAEKGQDIIF